MYPYFIFYVTVVFLALVSVRVSECRLSGKAAPAVLGIFVVGMAVWMWRVSEPSIAFSDFTVAYYPAGRAIIEDIRLLYKPCWDTPVCGFVNIPVVALLFVPFSLLTVPHAQILFTCLSLISLGVTVLMLWSIADASLGRKYAIILLFAINGPLFYSLKEGNLTHFVLLLLVAGVACLDKTWDRGAGAMFAMATVLKLPLLLFGLYFMAKRRWSVLTGYGSTLAGLSAVSIWYGGWTSHVEWYRKAILPFSNNGLSAFNIQSIQGFLLRLGDNAPLYDWKPITLEPEVELVNHLLASVLVGTSCLLCMGSPGRHEKSTVYLELSMVLCLALVISPITWTHYYLLLLLPLALYAGNRLPIADDGRWFSCMAVSLLLVTPPVIFMNPRDSFAGGMTTLWLSQYLIGAVLLWALCGYARFRVAQTHSISLGSAVQHPYLQSKEGE